MDRGVPKCHRCGHDRATHVRSVTIGGRTTSTQCVYCACPHATISGKEARDLVLRQAAEAEEQYKKNCAEEYERERCGECKDYEAEIASLKSRLAKAERVVEAADKTMDWFMAINKKNGWGRVELADAYKLIEAIAQYRTPPQVANEEKSQ